MHFDRPVAVHTATAAAQNSTQLRVFNQHHCLIRADVIATVFITRLMYIQGGSNMTGTICV